MYAMKCCVKVAIGVLIVGINLMNIGLLSCLVALSVIRIHIA